MHNLLDGQHCRQACSPLHLLLKYAPTEGAAQGRRVSRRALGPPVDKLLMVVVAITFPLELSPQGLRVRHELRGLLREH